MVFFNKLKNGIVKVAKVIGTVLKPVAQVWLPVAKQVLPTIAETTGNAFKPDLSTVARMGVTGLMNGLENAINWDQKQTIAYDDGVDTYQSSHMQSTDHLLVFR